MTIQTATRTKPEALPSPVEVMGTHAEALPVTVNGIASRVVLDQQEGTATKVYRKHFLVPEGLFVAGLGDPAHVSAIGLVLAAFAVKYRQVGVQAQAADERLVAEGPAPAREFSFAMSQERREVVPAAEYATARHAECVA